MEGEMSEKGNCPGIIQALNKNVVHKICTGQVILSLAAACKELIENSLDAGASVIEIRAKDHGLTCLEINDNGCGIKEENFRSLGQAHCTSKLTDFNDLVSLNTFGFRGEALNALMALSDLTIITRHGDSQVGHKLDYDHNGNLTRKLACARQVGTTVIVTNFFSPLPVRRKELEKNIKKEFNKLTSLIYSYCLICTKIRFDFVHTLNGKKQNVVVTHGNSSIKENLCNVFGSKQIEVLLEFQTCQPKEDVLMSYNLNADEVLPEDFFRIEGFVSGVQKTHGRSTTDRQYIFINGRPCDYQKVCRLINEVYHEYNKHQYPFVILNVCTNSDAIDVNVTPDKRSIFVANENFLLALLKSSIRSMYDATAGTYDVQASSRIITVPASEGKTVKRSSDVGDENSQPVVKQTKLTDRFRALFANTQPRDGTDADALSECSSERESLKFNIKTGRRCDSRDTVSSVDDEIEQSFTLNFHQRNNDLQIASSQLLLPHCTEEIIPTVPSEDLGNRDNKNQELFMSQQPEDFFNLTVAEEPSKPKYTVEKALEGVFRRSREVAFSFSGLKNRLKDIEKTVVNNTDSNEFNREFRAKIAPSDNKTAENELKRCITNFYKTAEDELKRFIAKDSFKQMNVIGQFNRGFIIVRLANDLFIVDQHATDEKYNFETLQKNSVVESQRLIQPVSLELTSAGENIVVDNLEIFRKNGFEFDISQESPKLKLTAAPICDKDSSAKQDIDDIIFMLTDFPGQMYRPPRLHDKFATKACRNSIMIGTTLSKEHMERIVSHMADIEQPWNCPHGRPTMRHLFNLKMLPD